MPPWLPLRHHVRGLPLNSIFQTDCYPPKCRLIVDASPDMQQTGGYKNTCRESSIVSVPGTSSCFTILPLWSLRKNARPQGITKCFWAVHINGDDNCEHDHVYGILIFPNKSIYSFFQVCYSLYSFKEFWKLRLKLYFPYILNIS